MSGLVLGFMGMGIVLVFHAGSPQGNAFVDLFVASQTVGAVGAAMAWLPSRPRCLIECRWLMPAVALACVGLSVAILWLGPQMPIHDVDGRFSLAARLLTGSTGALFIAGAIRLAILSRRNSSPLLLSFTAMLVLFAASSFAFTSSHLWDGTWWLWHLLRLCAFLLGLMVVLRHHRATEEALRASAEALSVRNVELQKTNAELDEFTRVASHDLQEPLRKLTSFSALLARDLGRDLPEKAQRDVDFIIDGAERMKRLISDLLRYSRSSRAEHRWDPVDLNASVDEVLTLYDREIEERRVRVIRADLPDVRGDRTMLTQTYQNLIGNALKFAGEGGPVVELTAEEDEDAWLLGVRDNGIGIDAEYHEQIFLPFRRLHTQAEYSGSGIGLALCQRVVERHGGRIWVESAPGQGAHFLFSLPKDGSQEAAAAQDDPHDNHDRDEPEEDD
jgi:signal transduction histidine kinase